MHDMRSEGASAPTPAMREASRQLYDALRYLWSYVSLPDPDDDFEDVKRDVLAAIEAAEK